MSTDQSPEAAFAAVINEINKAARNGQSLPWSDKGCPWWDCPYLVHACPVKAHSTAWRRFLLRLAMW